MRWLGRGLIAFALACGGCAGWRSARPELPVRDNVRLDQLVIHSNFEIPSQHRLLQEVNALRLDVSGKLGLSTSDEPIHVYLFEIGRASCREECRSRWSPFHLKKKERDYQMDV